MAEAKKSLVARAMEILEQHSKCCNPAESLIVGSIDDYKDDRVPQQKYPFTIWIANGMISLIISCPGDKHSATSGSAISAINLALHSTQSGRCIHLHQSLTTEVVNSLECHARFNKEDDGNFRLAHGEDEHLVISIESAIHHEDVHVLLCEASSWLHTATCCYVLCIKSWNSHPERGLGFMLVRRIHRKFNVKSPPKSGGIIKRRYCGSPPDLPELNGPRDSWDFPSDSQGIRRYYDMEVVKMFHARSQEEMNNIFLDLRFIFQRICPEALVRGERWVEVDLREQFTSYFAVRALRQARIERERLAIEGPVHPPPEGSSESSE